MFKYLFLQYITMQVAKVSRP